jgi:hypothetical protein
MTEHNGIKDEPEREVSKLARSLLWPNLPWMTWDYFFSATPDFTPQPGTSHNGSSRLEKV